MIVGKYHCALELQFSANTTVRLFAAHHRGQLTIFRTGGIPTLIAPQTRRIVEELLTIDERIDREGFGEGYPIRGCIFRGQFSNKKMSKMSTPFS